ncbi:MAG: histidine phosphatase family protein [Bacteroidia bacterium]|nr:histidine phosphatase family protein [Bacteroidia bacterium]NNM15809.1 histidine phosphatase family protein [Bacteroidia bacterium]
MKTLYLIRHAKSSWDNPSLMDKERPLKKRGKNDSLVMGDWLKKQKEQPSLFVSSPAKRAFSTAKRIAKVLNSSNLEIQQNEGLYFNGTGKILEVIRSAKDDMDVVAVFGHNPDITLLANQFDGKPILNVPTCGVLKVEFDVNKWKQVDVSNGKIKEFEVPKNLR